MEEFIKIIVLLICLVTVVLLHVQANIYIKQNKPEKAHNLATATMLFLFSFMIVVSVLKYFNLVS